MMRDDLSAGETSPCKHLQLPQEPPRAHTFSLWNASHTISHCRCADITETILSLEHVRYPDIFNSMLFNIFPLPLSSFSTPSFLSSSPPAPSPPSLSLTDPHSLNWPQDSSLSLKEDGSLYFENHFFRSTVHWPWRRGPFSHFLKHIPSVYNKRSIFPQTDEI